MLALVEAVVALCALPWVRSVPRAGWPYLALGSALRVAYMLRLVRSYDAADFSRVYPMVGRLRG